MKSVLIVDDEIPLLRSLKEGLENYDGEYQIILAEHGAKARAYLDAKPIDLVITDLKMPVMDGFELLAHMSKYHQQVPTIVMSAYTKSGEMETRLNHLAVSNYIQKPFSIKDLAVMIANELKYSSAGHIKGIALSMFLQLIEMEQRTCTLMVKSEDEAGYFYFTKGELLNAETGALSGAEAAYHMADWVNPEITITPRCTKKTKTIDATVNEILMEGCKRIDEKERRSAAADTEEVIADRQAPEAAAAQSNSLKEENVMALEKHLEALKEVKGYKAAGIMNYTGEMLASGSVDSNIDLTLVGATFNDIFRAAHEASKKIGLDTCRETVINTPKGVIVMRCSGVDAKAHFHVIGVMAGDGNQALMKMQIEKMLPAVMDELA